MIAIVFVNLDLVNLPLEMLSSHRSAACAPEIVKFQGHLLSLSHV